jgi:monofunctional biosynthetic peptidoglycan transglycosylase
MRTRLKTYAWRTLVAVLVVPAAMVLLFGVMPVPMTPLMVLRALNGAAIEKDWIGIDGISPHLWRSVIAAEDATFCAHRGFDLAALEKAWRSYRRGGNLRGGSTITMQTAKNLFLWPDRSFIRKGLEAWLTVYLEGLWTKRRTLEVYLNVVEWGPGIYGAEAAAQRHFGKAATNLDAREAALLASILPSPLRWSAARPGPYVRARAETIRYRAARLGDLDDCIAAEKQTAVP